MQVKSFETDMEKSSFIEVTPHDRSILAEVLRRGMNTWDRQSGHDGDLIRGLILDLDSGVNHVSGDRND